LNEVEGTLVAPQDWSTHIRDEQLALAEAAHVLRFGDADGNVDTPIQPQKMLGIRRTDDRSNDLWTTWSVVQENTIRGLRGQGRDDLGRPRRVESRAVNGIDQDIKLNKALWVIGERMNE